MTAKVLKFERKREIFKVLSRYSDKEPDFGNRLERIRTSLGKINKLMVALKEAEREKNND